MRRATASAIADSRPAMPRDVLRPGRPPGRGRAHELGLCLFLHAVVEQEEEGRGKYQRPCGEKRPE